MARLARNCVPDGEKLRWIKARTLADPDDTV